MVGIAGAGGAGLAALLPLTTWPGAFAGSVLLWTSTTLGPVMSARVMAGASRDVMARSMGALLAASFIGSTVASPFAGALAAGFGTRVPLAVGVAAFALAAVPLVMLGPPPERPAARGPVLPRRLWPILAVVPLAAFVAALPIPLLPLYLRDVAAIPLERVGLHVALMGVGTAIFAFVSGRVADAFGTAAAVLMDGAILALGAIGLVLLSGTEPAVGVAIVLVGANLALLPVLTAAVEPHLSIARRAAGSAALGFAFGLGASAASVLAGTLYEVDAALPYLATAALALPVTTMLAVAIARVARSGTGIPVLRSGSL